MVYECREMAPEVPRDGPDMTEPDSAERRGPVHVVTGPR